MSLTGVGGQRQSGHSPLDGMENVVDFQLEAAASRESLPSGVKTKGDLSALRKSQMSEKMTL